MLEWEGPSWYHWKHKTFEEPDPELISFFKARTSASEHRGDTVVMWTLDIRQDTDSQ